MKMYCVIDQEGGYCDKIIGVFSSKDKAEILVDHYKEIMGYCDDYRIEEYEVDEKLSLVRSDLLEMMNGYEKCKNLMSMLDKLSS